GHVAPGDHGLQLRPALARWAADDEDDQRPRAPRVQPGHLERARPRRADVFPRRAPRGLLSCVHPDPRHGAEHHRHELRGHVELRLHRLPRHVAAPAAPGRLLRRGVRRPPGRARLTYSRWQTRTSDPPSAFSGDTSRTPGGGPNGPRSTSHMSFTTYQSALPGCSTRGSHRSSRNHVTCVGKASRATTSPFFARAFTWSTASAIPSPHQPTSNQCFLCTADGPPTCSPK